jgi:hypothetical protein
MSLKRDWLDDGSLLIFMPRTGMTLWMGSNGGDYDRACEAAGDWLSPIDVGNQQAFLFGGDPGMALLLPGSPGELTVVRWVYADNEDDLIAFASTQRGKRRDKTPQNFVNRASEWVLFNAAHDTRRKRPKLRAATLPLGSIVAETAYLEEGPNAAIVHRFYRPSGTV